MGSPVDVSPVEDDPWLEVELVVSSSGSPKEVEPPVLPTGSGRSSVSFVLSSEDEELEAVGVVLSEDSGKGPVVEDEEAPVEPSVSSPITWTMVHELRTSAARMGVWVTGVEYVMVLAAIQEACGQVG